MESNIQKKYECDLEILSPVHIGAGYSYSLRECAYYKGTKKNIRNRIDISKYYASLPENDREKFLDAIVNKNFNLDEFHQSLVDQEAKMNKFIKNKKDQYTSLDSFIRYSFLKRTTQGNLDIVETAKTLDRIYFPGSSIKGAIRTALIYNSIDKNTIKRFVENKKFKEGEFNKHIEELFSQKGYENPAQADILKYLHISDSNTFHVPTVYQVNQILVKYDDNNILKGIEDGTKSFLETISFEKFKNTKSLKSKFIIDYNEDMIDRSLEKYLTIDSIKESVYEFSKDLIEFELNFAKKFKLDYLINFYQVLSSKNEPDSPILRIGAGSGLMGTSVALKIKKYDENIFNNLFNNNNNTIYPKSRRIAILKSRDQVRNEKTTETKSNTEGLPLGWVKLSFKEI